MASELKPDLRDTVDWSGMRLVDFNAGKTQTISFDRSNNTGAIDVKMDGSVLQEKSSFEMLRLTIFTAKTVSKKIGALIHYMKFLSPEVALYLYQSTIWPCMEYCHAWARAVVMPGLVLLVATWNCKISYKIGYAGLLVLHLLPLLKRWPIIEM